jgi:selenocysteine lyase/cysteine desulfurase
MPLAHPELGDRFRRQMPVAERWAYFDHAAVAPISDPAHQALVAWANQSTREGDTVWPSWSRRVGEIRQSVASLVGADPREIAFVRNTTEGIGLVAEGLPWAAGENVVVLADEFPSNQYPWLNLASRGVEARRVAAVELGPDGRFRMDLDRIAAAIDAKTRVVALSWVGYASGFRADLHAIAELVHRHGALFFLDAIQGLGAFPLDVRRTPIDFFAADGHKWLLGPEGAGVLYIRGEHLARLRPLGVGWHSVVDDHEYTKIELRLKDSAERYEGGSENMPGVLSLGASVAMLAGLDIEKIAERILSITELACDRLAAAGATIFSCRDRDRASGIVSFSFPGRDPQELRRNAIAANVALGCRAGRLRISPHAYQNEVDVDRLIGALL